MGKKNTYFLIVVFLFNPILAFCFEGSLGIDPLPVLGNSVGSNIREISTSKLDLESYESTLINGLSFPESRISNTPGVIASLVAACNEVIKRKSDNYIFSQASQLGGLEYILGLATARAEGQQRGMEFGIKLAEDKQYQADNVLEQAEWWAYTVKYDIERLFNVMLNPDNTAAFGADMEMKLGEMLVSLLALQYLHLGQEVVSLTGLPGINLLNFLPSPEILTSRANKTYDQGADIYSRSAYINFLEDKCLPSGWREMLIQNDYRNIGAGFIAQLKDDSSLSGFDKFLVFSSVLFPYFIDLAIDEHRDNNWDASGYCPIMDLRCYGDASMHGDYWINSNEGKNIFYYIATAVYPYLRDGNIEGLSDELYRIYSAASSSEAIYIQNSGISLNEITQSSIYSVLSRKSYFSRILESFPY